MIAESNLLGELCVALRTHFRDRYNLNYCQLNFAQEMIVYNNTLHHRIRHEGVTGA